MSAPDDYLLMSGIQHFCFCRRQWALIHLEQQWSENLRTAEGRLEHTRCHDTAQTERRGDLLITRGMKVVSHRLRLSGDCDVVEFRADPEGIPLQHTEGRWRPMPVEYKHGRAKENDADRLQLCAQAMADEMNQYFARGYTPKVKPGTFCNACSLKELCLPALYKRADPRAYLKAYLDEVQAEDTP